MNVCLKKRSNAISSLDDVLAYGLLAPNK